MRHQYLKISLQLFSLFVLQACQVSRTVDDAVPSIATNPSLNSERASGAKGENAASGTTGPLENQNNALNESHQGKNSEIAQSFAVSILDQVQSIEKSFSRGDCSDVAKRTLILRNLMTPEMQTALPLSTLIAMAECAARNQPSHTEQSERALIYLNEAAKNLTPTWDILLILSLKAERLEKLGRPREAQEVRLTLSEQLKKTRELEKRNIVSLQSLDPSYQSLTSMEKEKINQLLGASFNDELLFETLRNIDAASSSGSQAFQVLSRKIRDRTMLRIEELYAEDIAQVISALQLGQKEEARNLAEKIKRRFPTLNYARRTDATLGSFDHEDSMPLNAANQSKSEPSAVNTSDLTVQQRVTQARESLAQGRPDQSVQYLRSIPANARNSSISQLLNESEDAHIRDLRLRVRDLFKRAESGISKESRKADYEQALEILRFIIKEYPNHSTRKQIDKNIRNIEALLQDSRSKP